MRKETPRALHRYAVLLAGCVLGLIAAGGLVKSLEAGLAVPDWPTSYGSFNPPRWWEIENVRAEHGHRLIAGTVALMTFGLAVWCSLREPRRWVRRLAWGAFGTVMVQALLGGLTVLFFLPTPISVSHAAVAQLFLCLVVSVAVATSRSWTADAPWGKAETFQRVRPWATVVTGAVYCQILVGALVRHTGAGLAIPDFPTVFGGWVPASWGDGIGLHYLHRWGALIVTALVVVTVVRSFQERPWLRAVAGPATLLLALVLLQVALGGAVVLTGRSVLPNTVHVVLGGAILATSLVLTLTSWRGTRHRPTLSESSQDLEASGASSTERLPVLPASSANVPAKGS